MLITRAREQVVDSVVTEAGTGVEKAFEVVPGAAEFDKIDRVSIVAHHVVLVSGHGVQLEVQGLVKVDIAWDDVVEHWSVSLLVVDFAVASLASVARDECIIGIVLDD